MKNDAAGALLRDPVKTKPPEGDSFDHVDRGYP